MNAIALKNKTVGSADEARVLLVDSGFPGNTNPHKMEHVPAVEFPIGTVVAECSSDPCWRSTKANYWRLEGGEVRLGWYLHDARLVLADASPPPSRVDLKGYSKVLNLADWHATTPEVAKADPKVLNNTDPRVHSRVHINGGKLRTSVIGSTIEISGPPTERELAFLVEWDGKLPHVTISRLDDGTRPLVIKLLQGVLPKVDIRVLNLPVGTFDDQDLAHHIEEFYALTLEPHVSPRVKVKRKAGPGGPDVFCPPVELGYN